MLLRCLNDKLGGNDLGMSPKLGPSRLDAPVPLRLRHRRGNRAVAALRQSDRDLYTKTISIISDAMKWGKI
jgi:hypothetical protein